MILQLRTPDGKPAGRIHWSGDLIVVRLPVPPTAPGQWGTVNPLNPDAEPQEHRWWGIDYNRDPPTLSIADDDVWLFAYHDLLESNG